MKRRCIVSVDRLESRDTPSAVAFSNPVALTQVVIHNDAERNEAHRAVRDISTAAVIHYYGDPNE
jgi:hypothetical protein